MNPVRTSPLPRSFLYVPGDRPDLIAKARAGRADALVLDLEDAVSASGKRRARSIVGDALRSRDEGTDGGTDGGRQRAGSSLPELWVRVDSAALGADLEAVTCRQLDGVFLAKCEPDSLDEAGRVLTDLESRRGIAGGSVGIVGLLETAAAVTRILTMAEHPRLRTFGIGEVDLLADLRMRRGPRSAAALDSLRGRVVLDCAAAGCEPPVAPTSTDFRDLGAFSESSRTMLDLGFRSRTAIHPSQIPTIHDVFTPTSEELVAAHDIIDRLGDATGGVTVDAEGRLIDAAVIRSARETLGRADR
ncbi:hypothetical protein AX769_19545 [Frondihabitans sp. PAMC 28766]|uniref:HpcH/HpaI aldolase/citrate lyase family protein n=1 Tax=Frondihabitans sp. PAMC 28766 TaxID=1795630 RepID=UPI00078DC62D|nr:CoA ester lyase [Frondihabitans sp. PAMC 28766]AMM21936.1 hypothetical protein AX769_19545 [Frondihabitans sp. PAMC 28766]